GLRCGRSRLWVPWPSDRPSPEAPMVHWPSEAVRCWPRDGERFATHRTRHFGARSMNENPGQYLLCQHRHSGAAIKQLLAGDGDGDVAALHEALTMLRVHIRLEEDVLFDPIAATGLEMAI